MHDYPYLINGFIAVPPLTLRSTRAATGGPFGPARSQCSARVRSLSGDVASVWLEWPDVEVFVRELEALSEHHKGTASIAAMSPREFELSVAALGLRGHMAITFALGALNHTDNGQFQCSLIGGFEVEPTQVESALNWFRQVLVHDADA